MSPASRRGRRLLPAFLKVRGLVKQHLDSYNHLVDVEMRQIVEANSAVRCDQHPDFFLNFTNVYLGEPSLEEEYDSVRTWDAGKLTPQELAPLRLAPRRGGVTQGPAVLPASVQ